jgi:aryl-alcohol dehydrogenase-like predicted oxidoreductase
MQEAFDLGVTTFDTARSYGYGESEQILGDFVLGKRDKVAIFSKAGIRSLRPNAAMVVAKSLARRVFSFVPSLRTSLRSTLGQQHRGGFFEPADLRASVLESLRALRIERLDLLFLHDVHGHVAQRDDVFEELGRLIAEGKIGGSGVSGAAADLARFAHRREEIVAWQYAAARSAQQNFPANFPPSASPGRLRLGNRVFTDATEVVGDSSSSGASRVCAPLTAGVCDAVVASMYSLDHVRANVDAVSRLPFTAS